MLLFGPFAPFCDVSHTRRFLNPTLISSGSGSTVWPNLQGVVDVQGVSAVARFLPVVSHRPQRHPLGMTRVGSTARRQLMLAVVVTVVVVAAGSALPLLIPWANVVHVESVLKNVQATILFGAASLGLLSGHWAARTSAGFASAALLVLAFAGAVSATSEGQTGLGPVLSTGGAALAVVLLLAAAAAPEMNNRASFRRLLARESGPVTLLALVAVIPFLKALLVAGMAAPVSIRLGFSVLLAAGCLAGAAQVLRLDRPQLRWLPPVLVILAVAAVVRAFVGVWSGSLLVALGLEAVAGVFALAGAAMAVRTALVSNTDGMTSMLQDLSEMRDEDSRRRAEENERLHEVRSVLAGLRAATGSLRKYEDSLDPGIRRRLEDAVGAELSRLNQLIDPALPELTTGLDLEAVVMSVVVAEREQGLVVTTDLADVFVRGRPADVATLVSDLLVNARTHAPGSPVRLTARVDDGVVTLEVRDWGPGLSPVEAQRVFGRSYRGAIPVAVGVPGSGLGLYTARRLARQMQGDLQVRAPAGGGCCFVATLPVARHGDDQVLEALEAHWSTDPSQLVLPRERLNTNLTGRGLGAAAAGSKREPQ
jgi:signal transduction histidine kinase